MVLTIIYLGDHTNPSKTAAFSDKSIKILFDIIKYYKIITDSFKFMVLVMLMVSSPMAGAYLIAPCQSRKAKYYVLIMIK